MKMLRITLEGRTYDVGVEVLDDSAPASSPQAVQALTAPAPVAVPAASAPASPVAGGCRVVASPMAGQVFRCLVKPGDAVELNQVAIVLDAMKMETPVVAPVAGTVRVVLVKEGDAVDEGRALFHIE